MGKIKIISVSSLAAHRTASIKAQIAILGSTVLPVPTILQNGVTSYSLVRKQPIDFMPLLEGTLQLCIQQRHTPYLFIGYLAKPDDIDKLIEFIAQNRQALAGVLVDPISGDNDKPYIDAAIINDWPKLLKVADFAFPNLTELKIYSRLPYNAQISEHIKDFELRYPNLDFILTSYNIKNQNGVLLKTNTEKVVFTHKHFPTKFDGTGDVFAAYFIKYHIINGKTYRESCRLAVKTTLRLIRKAAKNGNSELEIL